MKHFLFCILITSALCACDKGKDNDTSASSPTKVENENPLAIPGAWMEETYRAAYELANSQNPDRACALLIKGQGTQISMTTPSNYFLIGKDGSFQSCNTNGGVGENGQATPITFECVPEDTLKVDLATGNLQGPKPSCTGKISANETRAIFSGGCDGKTETGASMRITPKGFETFITVAKDCMVKANAGR